MANPFKQGQAVLTKDFKVGISSKQTLRAGTAVNVEFKENPDDTTSYILCHRNFRENE